MIRPLTCVCMVLACAAGLYLYQTKHQAQVMDRDIQRAQDATRAARERIGMLRAEWALLQEPERLKELADQHLPLRTLLPGQFVQMSDLAERLPPAIAPGTALLEETAAPIAMPMVQGPQRGQLMAASRPAAPAPRVAAPASLPAAPVPAAPPPALMAAARPPVVPALPRPAPRTALAAAELPLPAPVPVAPLPVASLPVAPLPRPTGVPGIVAVSAQAVVPLQMPLPPHAPGAVLSDSAPLRPARPLLASPVLASPVLAPIVSAMATPITVVPPQAIPVPRPAHPPAAAPAAAPAMVPAPVLRAVQPASVPAPVPARQFQPDSAVAVSVLGISARPLLAPPVPVRGTAGQGSR